MGETGVRRAMPYWITVTYLGTVLAGILAHVSVDYGTMSDKQRPPGVTTGTARAAVLAGRVPVADDQVVVEPVTERAEKRGGISGDCGVVNRSLARARESHYRAAEIV